MRRKGIGIGAIQRQELANKQFKAAGDALAASQLEQMKNQMIIFKQNLEDFAKKYKKEIRNNPEFRYHFQKMCTSVGIDPLASSKGYWSELLGIGDFYFELGIRIVEICILTRDSNGGLLDLEELKQILKAKTQSDFSEDDIQRSIEALKPLGKGLKIVSMGSIKMVQSVAKELSTDKNSLLELSQKYNGKLNALIVKDALSWDAYRIQKCFDELVKDGFCWIDTQAEVRTYFVLALFNQRKT
ncbi:hypothetical protein MP638_001877 [Amoeboaphelidium occidentale]|jgi:ESCRT-II complex subunit VPS22|nr:hypothetical protein MP638_001877 [Amoeboaphelidium occidentale]